MKCRNHPEMEAAHACSECGAALCPECSMMPDRAGGVVCTRCEAMKAARDMVDRSVMREDRRREAKGRQEGQKRRRVALQVAVAVLCLGIAVYQTPALVSALQHEEKPIRSGTYDTDRETDEMIRRMWEVSALLRKGEEPGGSFVCPKSRKPFVVVKSGDDVLVRAPRPKLYGFREIRVSRSRPVPELIR